LNYAAGGLAVGGYHAVNLLIHVFCALLLFGIIRRTVLIRENNADASAARRLAGAIALAWAVHPLLTEGVTYIIQRTETLMSLFLLLTLYSVIRATTSDHPRRWYVVAIIACALGMGCKEVMAVTPLVVLAYDVTFLSSPPSTALRKRWGLYVALIATWAVLLPLTLTSGLKSKTGFGLERMTPWHYLLTQADVIVHYLRLCVWPHRLLIDYFDWPVAEHIGQVWWQGLIVLTLLTLTVIAIVRRLWIGFAGAWFFLILAPTSSFLPLGTEVAAERRMYLPSAAVVAVVVVAIGTVARMILGRPETARRVLTVLLVIVVSTEIWATWRRNATYVTAMSIWQDAVDQRPGSARAHHGLAASILLETHPQDTARAEAELRRCLDCERSYGPGLKLLGDILIQRKDPTDAVEFQESVVARFPKRSDGRVMLGRAYLKAGRLTDAEKTFQDALAIDPQQPDALYELGLMDKDNDPPAAERFFRLAISLQNDFADAHNALGVVLAKQHRFDEAEAEVKIALEQQPDYEDAQRNLARIREDRGK
jgi:protein O-mannosyl-transferase